MRLYVSAKFLLSGVFVVPIKNSHRLTSTGSILVGFRQVYLNRCRELLGPSADDRHLQVARGVQVTAYAWSGQTKSSARWVVRPLAFGRVVQVVGVYCQSLT